MFGRREYKYLECVRHLRSRDAIFLCSTEKGASLTSLTLALISITVFRNPSILSQFGPPTSVAFSSSHHPLVGSQLSVAQSTYRCLAFSLSGGPLGWDSRVYTLVNGRSPCCRPAAIYLPHWNYMKFRAHRCGENSSKASPSAIR